MSRIGDDSILRLSHLTFQRSHSLLAMARAQKSPPPHPQKSNVGYFLSFADPRVVRVGLSVNNEHMSRLSIIPISSSLSTSSPSYSFSSSLNMNVNSKLTSFIDDVV